MIISTFGVGL